MSWIKEINYNFKQKATKLEKNDVDIKYDI